MSLIDRQGAAFEGVFRLQGEDNARRLASIIAEFYGIDVQEEKR